MDIKTVGVACDHAGYPLKKYVLQYLEEKGYPYKDYGTWSDAPVDYPDFGHALAEGIESGEVYPGIGICGSGEGIALSTTTLPSKSWTSSSRPPSKADVTRSALIKLQSSERNANLLIIM